MVTAVFVAIIAAVTPLDLIASLANAGTLCAFIAVALCVLIMRRRAPEIRRPFTTPAAWLVAPLAIAGCLYLFTSLSETTQIGFFVWNGIGLLIYFGYGIARSKASAHASS
jgi:APA family basic amino acid/polyamine antiporter